MGRKRVKNWVRRSSQGPAQLNSNLVNCGFNREKKNYSNYIVGLANKIYQICDSKPQTQKYFVLWLHTFLSNVSLVR